MDPTTLMCSLPYWRKNKWNGAACKPVLMTLESGRLRAWDQQGEALFDAHIDAVEAKLSMAGTLTLRIEGRKWDFVGRGAQVSPKPTEEQRKAVVGFWLAHEGYEPPNTTRGPGIADQVLNGAAGWHMRLWRDALQASGARES